MIMILFLRGRLVGAHAGDHHMDADLSRMFERQGQRKRFAPDQLFLQFSQHQMQSARLQHDHAARRNVDIGGRAHLHHAILQDGLMQHGAFGHRGI